MAGKNDDTHSSLWSQTERRRVEERFRAALAGLMELEVLRSKHARMVEAALDDPGPSPQNCVWGAPPATGEMTSAARSFPGRRSYWVCGGTGDLEPAGSLSHDALCFSWEPGRPRAYSRSTENLLVLRGRSYWSVVDPLPENSRSWSSSGLCENNGDRKKEGEASSLSKSCASLTSWSPRLRCRLLPLLGSAAAVGPELEVIPTSGFLSVAGLCPESRWRDVSPMLQPHVVLELRYRSDLVSALSGEVYRYPSPLHAVALQSPLYPTAWDPAAADEAPLDSGCSAGRLNGGAPDTDAGGERHSKHRSLPATVSSSRTSGKLPRCDDLILRVVQGRRHQGSAVTTTKGHTASISAQGSLTAASPARSAGRTAGTARRPSACSETQVDPGSLVKVSARWSCAFAGGNDCASPACVGGNMSAAGASGALNVPNGRRATVSDLPSLRCSETCSD